MNYLVPALFQFGAILFVLVGIIFEVKRKARFGYILLTLAGWLAFVGEKLRIYFLR